MRAFLSTSGVNAEITEFVERTGHKPEEWRADWEASYNIAPTEQIPVLIDSARTGMLRFERADRAGRTRWVQTPIGSTIPGHDKPYSGPREDRGRVFGE